MSSIRIDSFSLKPYSKKNYYQNSQSIKLIDRSIHLSLLSIDFKELDLAATPSARVISYKKEPIQSKTSMERDVQDKRRVRGNQTRDAPRGMELVNSIVHSWATPSIHPHIDRTNVEKKRREKRSNNC